jgi:signal transduction histidine kinase/ligand-binding sensor domain-containing protein
MRYFSCILFLLLYSLSYFAWGQANETGLPFIQNFSPKQYHGNTQNWAIVQDRRGLMYFGNNKGVLEYDGVNWRLIQLSNQSTARSLAIDSAGTIYVGGVGEFGYLAPDSVGNLVYESLVPKNKDEGPAFADVWSAQVRGNEVFFLASNILFRYKGGELSSWPLKNAYHRSFLIYNQLYLRDNGVGLLKLEEDSLRQVPGGNIFKENAISAMLPYQGNILIGARKSGLHLYELETGRIKPIMPEASELLKESILYHGTVLVNGNLAFATIKNGLLLLDREGTILKQLDNRSGLLEKVVTYLYQDKSGILWMGLGKGIAKVEVNAPIRLFDKRAGLEGSVTAITRYKGRLYVGTDQGVSYFNEEGQFVAVEGIELHGWQLRKFKVPGKAGEEKLLVANSFGVYEIEKASSKKIAEGAAFSLEVSRTDSSRIYVGYEGAIGALRYEEGQWVDEGRYAIVKDELRSIAEDKDGNLWMGTIYSGIFRLKVKDLEAFFTGKKELAADAVRQYDTNEGLPFNFGNRLTHVQNEVLVTSQKGIYRFNAAEDKFEEDAINRLFGEEDRWFFYLAEDEDGNLWFDSDQGKGMLFKNKEGYALGESRLNRISVSSENDEAGYPDGQGVMWFGTADAVFRYDSKLERSKSPAFNVLIRKVIVGEDSLIFNGSYPQAYGRKGKAGPNGLGSHVQPPSFPSILPYTENSLTFHFAAPEYELEGSGQFAYYLVGYDKSWSAWTRETRKEYTNLPEGSYTFKVKGKNLYGIDNPEAVFKFTVLPPWYRHLLAYVSYLIIGFGAIYLVAIFYSNKLKKDNQRLETIVRNRTAEIEAQKSQVERSYQNVTSLSQIGQRITATLDSKSIIQTLYESIETLMNASSFGVGIYDEERQSIIFEDAHEEKQRIPAFSIALSRVDNLAVWCFNHKKEVYMNDMDREIGQYLSVPPSSLPAGKRFSQSVIYLPLQVKEKVVGVISVQSFEKGAYQPYHLDILRSLAAYTAIALDNSSAYLRVNEINGALSTTLEHLKHTQTQLVQSEKMASLGQLTAGVAHEINNPINFVSAGIDSLEANYNDLHELLEKLNSLKAGEDNTALLEEVEKLKKEIELDYLLEEIPQLLQSIKTGASRTTEIVKSLKNFTRLDEDNLKLANLHEGLDSTLVILRNQLNEKVKIVREYDASLPLVQCYPGQLNQVFMNIINNAIQAVEEEGEIWIATALEGEQVVIKIKDTGIGMSQEVKSRIFEPFFTTKDVGEGTGLGLSISYSIIEKHKGTITVESAAGKGTEFIIRLPLNLN